MKNTLLQSIIDDSLNHMFVVDKSGKTIFFPWGGEKQGYLLKSKSLMAKIKKFYTSSFVIWLVIFLIATALFHNFWGIVGSIIVSLAGWYLAYYLCIVRMVKSLPVTKASYNKIVLEKLEQAAEQDSSDKNLQFPVHWNRPLPQRKWNIFAQIQHIWYRLSPGEVFIGCFFVSLFTALIWSMYRPPQWIDADYFVGFFACLLLGYGCFVVTQHMASTKVSWFEFRQIRLAMFLVMVGSWSFAAWLLYKFVVVVLT